MASIIDDSALTLNPVEAQGVSEFIWKTMMNQPAISELHSIWSGYKLKTQIVLASTGISGTKDTICTRPNTGAQTVLTQVYADPKDIGDTFVHCSKDLDPLFKSWANQIRTYQEKFDLTGSELAQFIAVFIADSAQKSILRFAWLGDTAVAASGVATPGLIAGANSKYFDAVDGLWKKIFAGVTAGDIQRYSIALNGEATKTAQLTFTANLAQTYLDNVYENATPELRQRQDAIFYVSGKVWRNYLATCKAAGVNYDVSLLQNGLQMLEYNFHKVVNMETIWDKDLTAYFEGKSDHSVYYLPNRVVFTVPENIPLVTLENGVLGEMETWFDKTPRTWNMAYGYTLDPVLINTDLVSVGY